MVERLIRIRKDAGLTQAAFAKKLSLTRGYVSQVENGYRRYSNRTLSDICRMFSVNKNWILTGEGEPYLSLDESKVEYISDLLKRQDNEFFDINMHAVETYSQLDPTQKSGLKTFVKQMSCNMYPTAYLQREWEVG